MHHPTGNQCSANPVQNPSRRVVSFNQREQKQGERRIFCAVSKGPDAAFENLVAAIAPSDLGTPAQQDHARGKGYHQKTDQTGIKRGDGKGQDVCLSDQSKRLRNA